MVTTVFFLPALFSSSQCQSSDVCKAAYWDLTHPTPGPTNEPLPARYHPFPSAAPPSSAMPCRFPGTKLGPPFLQFSRHENPSLLLLIVGVDPPLRAILRHLAPKRKLLLLHLPVTPISSRIRHELAVCQSPNLLSSGRISSYNHDEKP